MGRQIIRTGGPGKMRADARRAAIVAVVAIVAVLAIFYFVNAHRPAHATVPIPAAASPAGGMGH